MAPKLYSGAYLTSFVDAILEKVSLILKDDSFLERKILLKLGKSLYEARPVLDDAEQKQFTEEIVKKWLLDLQDALYMADDLVDELSTTKAAIPTTLRDPGISSSLGSFVDSYIEDTGDMEKIVGTLESVVAHKDLLCLEKSAKVDMPRTPSTSLVVSSDIFGRDKDKEKIIKLLLDDTLHAESPVTVIPIVGMGGIGKTTLAQLVYNDDQVQQKFNVKAWVCIGEVFDVLKVTKTVVEKATSGSCNMNDLDSVQQRLRTEVTGKRFLVVVDDMWTNDYDDWKTFLIPFQCGSQGGKILVTTRIDAVASMVKTIPAHNLSLLDDEQCWSVFANHAFFATESRDRSALEKVGRKLVEKCQGLPLAAQSLGGLLRTKDNVSDWEAVLKSEIWEFSKEECRILPALRISYHYLPSHLKRCFVYCSLYPKDYEFNRGELILLWMAEDLLQQPKSRSTLEQLGHKCVNDLAARSFFQPSKNGYEDSFVMHDLMHDLATFYGEKFFVRISEHKNVAQHDTKTRHLSYDLNDNDSVPKMLEACKSLSHVRTLFQIKADFDGEHKEGIDPSGLLAQLKRLRVLSFKSFQIEKLPDSIGKLIHLRYLNLSNTLVVSLPEPLNNLYNLQTLKLANCKKLKKLPSNMQNLVNLRHLDIKGTDLEEMPRKMSKLKDLQFLSDYIVGKHEENRIGELGELANLHGSLSIAKLENVENGGEASSARMDEKIHLNALNLEWSSWSSWSSFEESEVCDSQTERDVLDKLCPHKELKELRIWGYRGTMFPDWVGHSLYYKITKLELRRCSNCWMLPSLGQLPALTRLEISDCDMVEMIGGSFYKGGGTQETPFRSLKYLSFSDMSWWVEWESYECDKHQETPFPQLAELWIQNCPTLRGDLPTFLPSLKSLHIVRCQELGCDLPIAPMLRSLTIDGNQKARMRDLPLSMLETLWVNGKQQVEYVFEAMTRTQPTSLIHLQISECSSAMSFPGDSLPPSLEDLSIEDCKNVEFPMQHQQHESLRSLRIDNSCDSLTSFAFPAFTNLKYLTIARRENLTSLELSQSQSLQELRVEKCPELENIIRLPASLTQLRIDGCPLLASLELSQSQSLRELAIEECPKLENIIRLPASLTQLRINGCPLLASLELSQSQSLGELSILRCPKLENIIRLPASLTQLRIYGCPLASLELSQSQSLRELSIEKCPKLENIIRLPASLTQLRIYGCPLLASLELSQSQSLRKLAIEYCAKLENIIRLPASLTQLRIDGCPLLASLELSESQSLQELVILGCPKLKNIIRLPASLTQLTIDGYPLLASLKLSQSQSLRELSIVWCPKLENIIRLPASLTKLRICGCPLLASLELSESQLQSLRELAIGDCPKLENIIRLPASLTKLRIYRCSLLASLELSQSQSLRKLAIEDCPKLENIIRLPASLSRLYIRKCPLLGEGIERKDPHIWPSISHIPQIYVDRRRIRNDSAYRDI